MTDPTADKDRALRFGTHNDEVRKLQGHLNQLGYRVEQDGVYGRDTQGAVRHLQAHAHIQADGVAGPQTLAAVDSHLRADYHAPRDWRDSIEHHEQDDHRPGDHDGEAEVSASADVQLGGMSSQADDEAANHADPYGASDGHDADDMHGSVNGSGGADFDTGDAHDHDDDVATSDHDGGYDD